MARITSIKLPSVESLQGLRKYLNNARYVLLRAEDQLIRKISFEEKVKWNVLKVSLNDFLYKLNLAMRAFDVELDHQLEEYRINKVKLDYGLEKKHPALHELSNLAVPRAIFSSIFELQRNILAMESSLTKKEHVLEKRKMLYNIDQLLKSLFTYINDLKKCELYLRSLKE